MAEIKTRENDANVGDFLNSIADEKVRSDCRRLEELMSSATGADGRMWGDAIVGFGRQHLRYASGREVDWMIVGFSPRKQNLTLYLSSGEAWDGSLLARLGKHKVGMGCLYFKRLSDIDEGVLVELIEQSVRRAKKNG